ncbi:endonuclease Q family protein [Paraliobacillus zengyii]|uniref:endonuclease Q family protein n=1 Tax=Paraliobacillus zengyii TaxID=2213194 RepID=UPI000DD464A4|nr:endonuclease Q family protein [Paraliobacillus zengyii]
MSLQSIYADLHIHIGRDYHNKPVKITGSKTLTLTNILKEASRKKGIQLIGVIDCHVPAVQNELDQLLATNKAEELEDGGIKFEEVTLILGSEIEVYDENCHGPIHVLCYLPNLHKMKQFTDWLSTRMTNINLSSQRYYGSGKDLQYKVKELEGLFIIAHVFTPFKSLYGKGVNQSLTEVFDPDLIDAIELGLSSDTEMADVIKELHAYTFLTNSDAHSLAKIAREYQKVQVAYPSFKELTWALHRVENRKIEVNYGMNPQLGKYHTTVCKQCLSNQIEGTICKTCGHDGVIKGVADRINELKDTNEQPINRVPYIHQIPLEYIKGLGPKTVDKLLETFGTEMNIIHHAAEAELTKITTKSITKQILQMREGKQTVKSGGGGKYGQVTWENN